MSLTSIILKPIVGTANLITRVIGKVTGKPYTLTTAEEAAKTKEGKIAAGAAVVGVAAGAGLIAGAGAVITAATAAASKLPALAKSLIPTTAKGKIIAAVAAPVVVGAIVREPIKSITAIAKAPGELAQFGGDVASFAVDPSLKSAARIIKESPIISAGIAAVAAAAAAKTLLPAAIAGKIAGTAATNATGISGEPSTSNIEALPTTKPSIMPSNEELPATAQTTTISTGKKRHRRPTIKEKPTVRQNVRVQVITQARSAGIRLTKNYINREVLAV